MSAITRVCLLGLVAALVLPACKEKGSSAAGGSFSAPNGDLDGDGGGAEGGTGDEGGAAAGSVPNGVLDVSDACLAALGTPKQATACAGDAGAAATRASLQLDMANDVAAANAACLAGPVDKAPDCYAKAKCSAWVKMRARLAAAGLSDPEQPNSLVGESCE